MPLISASREVGLAYVPHFVVALRLIFLFRDLISSSCLDEVVFCLPLLLAGFAQVVGSLFRCLLTK